MQCGNQRLAGFGGWINALCQRQKPPALCGMALPISANVLLTNNLAAANFCASLANVSNKLPCVALAAVRFSSCLAVRLAADSPAAFCISVRASAALVAASNSSAEVKQGVKQFRARLGAEVLRLDQRPIRLATGRDGLAQFGKTSGQRGAGLLAGQLQLLAAGVKVLVKTGFCSPACPIRRPDQSGFPARRLRPADPAERFGCVLPMAIRMASVAVTS